MNELRLTDTALLALIDEQLDRQYLIDTALELAAVPTAVPPGFNTLIEPDDPILVHYVQRVVRPKIHQLGLYDLLDAPRNNLVVRLGAGHSDQVFLLQNYTPIQHHNLMENPFQARVANAHTYGCDEPAIFAQGISQNKGHQATMLAVLKLLQTCGLLLNGRLYWAINNEGRSSHTCSYAILDSLDMQPTFGILQNRTGLRISLGNRGRVDVSVHVRGKTTHSSHPHLGLSAIEGANEVINRLKQLHWREQHPILGERQAVVYKVRYAPVLPHTLPSDAYLTIDRRLLPGDTAQAATEEIRAVLGDMSPYEVSITENVMMLPALVAPDHSGVQALQAANLAVRGHAADTFYGQGTFDAGGPCDRGVPTIMYGASGGDWPTGIDYVPISALETEARVLAFFILRQLL